MKIKKLISCVLAACTLFSVTACNGKNNSSSSVDEAEMLAKAPDYSAYTHKFESYCYSGPNDGHWNWDDSEYYIGKDLRTVENYQIYKDAGMTIYLPQTDARMGVSGNYLGTTKVSEWNPQVWENREKEWESTKVFWDRAYEAGLEKIIMTDVQFQSWSRVEHGMLLKPADVVIPEGEESPYTFQSEEEFDEVIAKLLEPYIDHPAFYGVMLKDEPSYACVEAYGQTYRAIKRAAKNYYNFDIFVQHNLFPMRCNLTAGVYSMLPLLEWFDDEEDTVSKEDFYTMVGGGQPNQEVISPKEEVQKILEAEVQANGGDVIKVGAMKFEKYLEGFALSMGSDYLQYDDYPLRGTEEEPEVLDSYLLGLQIAAGVCKKLDIDLQFVTQSYASTTKRLLTEDDCRWMNNMLLAFGVSQINYYTYIAKKDNSASDEYYNNYGSFITRQGDKTDIYYYYQKINQENNKFAPVKLNFKYQGSRVYNVIPANFKGAYYSEQWMFNNEYQFAELKGFSLDKETALVTESYDKENNRYMYCVQNIVDSAHKGSYAYQTMELTFDAAKYKYAAVYRNGERTLVPLDNGKLIIENAAGQAAFVIPY